jgi:hypothetical protein
MSLSAAYLMMIAWLLQLLHAFHQVIGFDVVHFSWARGAIGPTETLQLDTFLYVLFAAYHCRLQVECWALDLTHFIADSWLLS